MKFASSVVYVEQAWIYMLHRFHVEIEVRTSVKGKMTRVSLILESKVEETVVIVCITIVDDVLNCIFRVVKSSLNRYLKSKRLDIS